MARNLVFKVFPFKDECKFWRNFPYTDQTWVKFQDIFTEAELCLKTSRQSTIMSGYGNYATNVNDLASQILQQKIWRTEKPFPTISR